MNKYDIVSEVSFNKACQELILLEKEEKQTQKRINYVLPNIQDKNFLRYLRLKLKKKQQGIIKLKKIIRMYRTQHPE